MKNEAITKQVFLSYAGKDKALADILTKELNRQGFKVWSGQEISAGTNWSEEITKALEESDSMIAILNQHSFSSSYVRNELQHAFFDERYKNRLLPVLISPTSDIDFIRLPWVLTKMTFLKITGEQSPKNITETIIDKFIALLKEQKDHR